MIVNGYAYVDKTLMIKQILERGSKVFLHLFPRRFGKTLNLSMVDYFFNIKYKDETDLFDGLLISEHPECLEHRSKYPVIHLDLSTLPCNSFEEFEKSFSKMISTMMTDFDYLREEELSPRERMILSRLSSEEDVDCCLEMSLYKLSVILKRVHGIAPIIIFDGYDHCHQRSFDSPDYSKITEFMSDFMKLSLKNNTNISFGIVSGILHASKECRSIIQFDICNMFDNKFEKFYGFTQDEVTHLVERLGRYDILDDLKEWYGGYRFGSTMVYNPWSIMCCLHNGGTISDYWADDHSKEIIENLIMKNHGKGVANDIISLMSDPEKTVESGIDPFATFEEIMSNNDWPMMIQMNLHTLMVMTGHLKAVKNDNSYQLSIPNKEVRRSYDGLVARLFDSDTGSRSTKRNAA